ncbi:MAG: Ig-like domain repeat protein, partial [Sphingobacteriales bacterium]
MMAFLVVAMFFGGALKMQAQYLQNVGPGTVTTDKPDYAPRSNAVFTGTGFQPYETVQLKVKNLFRACNTVTADSSYSPWTVKADATGNFVTNWLVCDCLGDSLRLKATGQSSSYTAYAYFSDGGYQFAAAGLPSSTNVVVNYTISGSGGGNGTFDKSFTPPATEGGTINNKTISANNYSLTYTPTTSIKYNILNYGLRVGASNQPTNLQISNSFTVGGGSASNAVLFTANYGVLKVNIAEGEYGGTTTLTANFYSNFQTSTGISGKLITFYINGTSVGSTNTNASGLATLSGVNLGTRNVGNYTITASFGGDASTLAVTAANSTQAALVIEPKQVVITPTALSKEYGSADPAFTFSNDGNLVDAAFTGTLSRDAGESVVDGPYSYTLGTLSAGTNYSLSLGNTADFTITTKAASVTPAANSKEYGSAEPSLGGATSGFLA